MKAVLAVFWQFVRGGYRDKYSLFWNLAFPLILMTILVLIFSNMDRVGSSLEFQIGLVNLAQPEAELDSPRGSHMIETALTEISEAEEGWLRLYRSSDQSALASELHQLERGNRHAVLVIPPEFDHDLAKAIAAHFSPDSQSSETSQLAIHTQPNNQLSTIAADILEQVLAEVNIQMNLAIGLSQPADQVVLEHFSVEPAEALGRTFRFADYLLPGIILMVFLASGLELVVERISVYREKGILKRHFATPLHPLQYAGGLLLYIVVLSVVQVLLIYGFGRLMFDVNIPLLHPLPLFYLVFSLITLLILGWSITALAKSANAANGLANGLMYPLAFLGGLYFPVTNMAFPLSLLVYANPVTYLVNGLRDSLGVLPSPTSTLLNLGVPLAWAVLALIFSAVHFRWDERGGN